MSGPSHPTPQDAQSGKRMYDVELPLDPGSLRRNARAHGFSLEEADVFAQLALQKLREAIARKKDGEPVTALQIAEAIKKHAVDEVEKERARERKAKERGMRLVGSMDDDELEAFLEAGIGDEDGEGPGGGGSSSTDSRLGLCEQDETRVAPQRKRFKFSNDGLDEFFGPSEDPYSLAGSMAGLQLGLSLKHAGVDLITALCRSVELAVELAKHLGPEDIVSLYSVSRAFHDALDGHLLSSLRQIIAHSAPEAGRVFPFRLYRALLVPDPAGRTWGHQMGPRDVRALGWTARRVRSVPGLRYLQLVLGRDRCCRQIVAMMARHGHRMPQGTLGTLLRIWLLMDIPTSRQRLALMRNRGLWTDTHLYNAQLFIVKLGMLFSDPVYGPLTFDVPHLILGQRGLYFLWQVLMRKRFTRLDEILEAKAAYDLEMPPVVDGENLYGRLVFGVPFCHVGTGHTEGWGAGDAHLMRPDELVPYEAVVRGLHLDDHLVHMMAWGYFDWRTGENLVPTEDEMYISDEERVLAHVDTSHLWQRRHALKKRWASLTPDQQRKIRADDDDDRLRALAWAASHPTDGGGGGADDDDDSRPPASSLDDEINRGCLIRAPYPGSSSSSSSQPPCPVAKLRVPALADHEGWVDFCSQVLRGLPGETAGDEQLRALAWNTYRGSGADLDWDWLAWLDQEEAARGREIEPAADSDEDECDEDDSDEDECDEDDGDGDGDGGTSDDGAGDEETSDEEVLSNVVEDFFDHVVMGDADQPDVAQRPLDGAP